MQKHSTVEVLGCSGSIGISGQGTTSFLLDDDILIDAGTGLCGLPLERLERIQHVFITHSHLDHLCALPLLIDAIGTGRAQGLTVYGRTATITAMQQHVFNNIIWPDFTQIPNINNPMLKFVAIDSEIPVTFGRRQITLVDVHHSVPCVGIVLDTPTGRWCFSGDTHRTDRLYEVLNAGQRLDYLFIESAFADHERWLADISSHLCPELLFQELKKLTIFCEVWVLSLIHI
jgi:cAMP phosphodiesterase